MDAVTGKAEVIIGKQRHGPTGTVQLQFTPEFTRFGNLASGGSDAGAAGVTGGRPPQAKSHHLSEDAGETAILTIDLDGLIANYRRLRELAGGAECAAVVKADAYGLGVVEAAPALRREGCKTFFVATPAEAKALRKLLPDAIIYALAGLMPGMTDEFRKHDLRPVLNSAAEIREWAAFSASVGEALPCAVHIDSGMNRLGLSAAEVETVAAARDLWSSIDALAGDESPRLRR